MNKLERIISELDDKTLAQACLESQIYNRSGAKKQRLNTLTEIITLTEEANQTYAYLKASKAVEKEAVKRFLKYTNTKTRSVPDQFKARLKQLADYGFTLKGDDQVLQAFTADSFETLFTITHEAIGRMNNNEWALKVNQVRKFLKETKKTK